MNRQTARILVVDDDKSVRGLIDRELRKRGHMVVCASDGCEAIDIVGRETFDLVITDLNMPCATGDAVLEAVKLSSPSTEVVVMTGDARDAATLIRGGAFDFLAKPFQLEDFLMTVCRAIEHRRDDRDQPPAWERIVTERVEAVGQVAAGILHGFHGPLTRVSVRADYMADTLAAVDRPDSDGLGADLAEIIANLESLSSVLADVRVVARGTSEHIDEIFDANTSVRAALRVAGADLRPVKLTVDLADGALLRGRPARLSHAVTNLVLNACQALARAQTQWPCVTVRTRIDEGDVVVEITDNGPGIDSETLQRVLDTVAPAHPWSSGLGLGVATEIVREHGGDLSVHTEAGRGTTVQIRLPRVDAV